MMKITQHNDTVRKTDCYSLGPKPEQRHGMKYLPMLWKEHTPHDTV